jgi:hypothetical protein
MATRACRLCGARLKETFIDLGMSPLANSYLQREHLAAIEPFYPLHARVCERCYLVQLDEVASPATIFQDYAYFSSFSDTWLKHAADYTAQMVARFSLTSSSAVVEVASNDGYLLQYFRAMAIPILGIEPAENVATVAKRALKAGEMLDGEGGYTIYGKLVPAARSLKEGALPIGLAFLKVRQRTNHFDGMEGQKFRQIFLALQKQDRQVAPIHDMSSQASGFRN